MVNTVPFNFSNSLFTVIESVPLFVRYVFTLANFEPVFVSKISATSLKLEIVVLFFIVSTLVDALNVKNIFSSLCHKKLML